MAWVKKQDGGDGNTYDCDGCLKRISIMDSGDAPVSNNYGTWCWRCVDDGLDEIHYHYYFDEEDSSFRITNDLVVKMNQFAKGFVTVDNNSVLFPHEHRIHCYHSCKKFRGLGAYAVRGDYIVYDRKGNLVSVLNSKRFHELYEEVKEIKR